MRNFNKYILNTSNLRCNITLIRRLLKDNVKLCAVVKADAYGLGVDKVCGIIDKYIDFYAVSNIDEAKQIRELGYRTNILILGEIPLQSVNFCAENNISISISNYDYLKAIIEDLHSSVKIHLKVNSGLNRYGFKSLIEFKKSLKLIKNNPSIKLEGVFTHFATKSNDIEFINIQKNIFADFCALVPNDVIKHCANSFATMLSSIYQMDMVRVGINMYGDLREEKLPLKDVLTIKSEIVAINDVKRGQSVGYDRTFIADKNCKIAVVPLGYADGISRKLSNNFFVLINGQKAKIVGNVCMDCFMVDISDIKNVFVGSEVVVIGQSHMQKITLNDYAKALKTSPYEILVNFKYKRCEYVVK